VSSGWPLVGGTGWKPHWYRFSHGAGSCRIISTYPTGTSSAAQCGLASSQFVGDRASLVPVWTRFRWRSVRFSNICIIAVGMWFTPLGAPASSITTLRSCFETGRSLHYAGSAGHWFAFGPKTCCFGSYPIRGAPTIFSEFSPLPWGFQTIRLLVSAWRFAG